MKIVAQSLNFSESLIMAALMAAGPLWNRVQVLTKSKKHVKMLIIAPIQQVII